LSDFLPYSRQTIDNDDIDAVVQVLRGDWLTTGPAVVAFEAALAERTSAPHAIACANGTVALHLAALAMGLGEGDVAIVPTVTFLATANAVRYTGAEVVFADVDPDSGLMTASTLKEALARAGDGKARAVLPVHLAGQTVDMAAISDISDTADLTVIEDAAHAIGTMVDDNGKLIPVGSCANSVMTTFSFHPVKTIAMGEGGAITTRDPALAERLAQLRNHGMSQAEEGFSETEQAFAADGTRNPWYYEMAELGFNYRVTDMQCALGFSQMSKLDASIARRHEIVAWYDERLAGLAPLVLPLKRTGNCAPAWHLYVALIDFAAAGIERGALMTALRSDGIGTQVHYIPVHRQPYYRRRYGAMDLPGADRYYERALSLPMFPAMEEGDVDRVVEALARHLGAI
jgi:UDP-4-amino-4,6-dideoxy-N-acetyl-beta-L-altrosamine transaminase